MSAVPKCKECGSYDYHKNGVTRDKQRYRCHSCGMNFVEGDERVKEFTTLRKALAVIFYRLTNTPYEALGKYFGVSREMARKWVVEFQAKIPKKQTTELKVGMKYDQIKAFIEDNKDFIGSKKEWIVAKGEVFPGFTAIMIVRRSEDAAEE